MLSESNLTCWLKYGDQGQITSLKTRDAYNIWKEDFSIGQTVALRI